MSECDICAELADIKATLADHGDKLSILLTGVGALLAAAPGAFTVQAVNVGAEVPADSNANILTAAAATIGAAADRQFTYCMWVRRSTGDEASTFIPLNASSELIYQEWRDGVWDFGVSSESFAESFNADTGAPTVTDSWVWLGVSVDTDFSTGAKKIVACMGDTVVMNSGTDGGAGAFDIGYADASFGDWQIGPTSVGYAGVAEVWAAQEYIDFSVEANRRKFISAGGKPVDLGATGATPTGNQPIIYLSARAGDSAADFLTNRGTGGDFTASGTLALAGTSPSD